MATIKRLRSFRVNPIEVVIFSTVASVFAHSVYRLFSEPDAMELTALTKTAETGSRGPASTSVSGVAVDAKAQQALSLIQVGCQSESTQDAASSKVRVQGTDCNENRKPAAATESTKEIPNKLSKVTVKNLTHPFKATVFIDTLTQGFVTDYITLKDGSNELKIQRTYDDGKTYDQTVVLKK